jgi:small GTP-binding protein
MLGSFGVGKTSLVRQFVYRTFEEKYLSTIGVQISQKVLPPLKTEKNSDPAQLKFILWDLAQIEKFNSVIKNYFRGAHGAIVVFDLIRDLSMQDYQSFFVPFNEMNPNAEIVFVGNKLDLVEPDCDACKQIAEFAQKHNTSYFLTSAKTGQNVEKLFIQLGKQLLERR